MSGCWCKCEAGLGQCGPKVPRLKTLFGAHKADDASLRRGDRLAELQVIWETVHGIGTNHSSSGKRRIKKTIRDLAKEIGENTSQKLEDLRQLIAAAVDKVYDKALEEGVRRRTALEENVLHSEKRLAEILGPESAKLTVPGDADMEFMLSWLSTQEALQSVACASSQLPLQARLDMNMARMLEVDSERLGAYGWVGGLVVMVELRHRVLLLRETLNLPPCDPLADLDKVIAKTMEDINSLYPGKAATLTCSEVIGDDRKPVMQRLQRFYQSLRAIESTWIETFVQKDGETLQDHMEKAAQVCLRNIEEKRNARKRTRDVQQAKSEGSLGIDRSNPSCSASKSQSSKNKITRPNTSASEESLEVLSQSIIHKLDTLNQLKLSIAGPREPANPVPSFQEAILSDKVNLSEKPASTGRCSPESSPSHPGKTSRTPISVRTRVTSSASSASFAILSERTLQQPAEIPIEAAGLSQVDLLPCTARETQDVAKIKPADVIGERIALKDLPTAPAKSPGRDPLRNLPNCTTIVTANLGAAAQAMRKPPPPPPRPPPPPPPMPLPGSSSLLLKRAGKLKRSVKISRLYRNLKSKIEGAARGQMTAGLASSSRRLSTNGTREGMAEALAEITKKSTYFQKIENDVQKYRDAIEESKAAVNNFETADMGHLLRFHKNLESILEKLTDETQVLARFRGFPSSKLETLRLAAALYSRLLSMTEDLEKWEVRAPVAEQLDKIIRYFDKIKKELELVESTMDEDLKRFTSQKIKFDFSILGRIKEAMVGLSSRCLVQALEESKLTSFLDTGERGYAYVDLSRQRLCSQMLWKAFQLAYRVYNFAGGHDDQSESLISEIASQIDSFPADVWL